MSTELYLRPGKSRVRLNTVLLTTSILLTLFAVGLLLWIILSVVIKGYPALSLHFFTAPTVPDASGGMGNALLGTLMITFGAAAMAIPVGLLGGVYLAEFARNSHMGKIIRFSANVMMGIPSIIVGLFLYAVMVIPMGTPSGFAGSCALAILMLPIIMRTTEDMLEMVPNALRESGLALGIPRWKVTLRIVFGAARNGLVTGILLALARVAGETAPLLFTAQWSMYWPSMQRFFNGPTANITVTINEYFGNDFRVFLQDRAWGAALVILILILGMNIAVRRFCSSK